MDVRTEAGPGPTAGVMAEAVEKAVGYLASVQHSDGGFTAIEHAEPDTASPGTPEPSPFVTASVLHALSLTDTPSARPLIDRGAAWLLREMEEPGVWRRASADPPIAPDVDVTCCASFALRRLGFGAGNEAAVLANLSSDGLFRTWLRPPDAANDFDSVVNANVLLYLGERRETAACEMLCEAIVRGMEEATYYYYVDPLALHYAVARAFAHGVSAFARCRDTVVGRTLARQDEDGGWESDLLTGMAVCTLAGFGLGASREAVRGARLLAETQHPDGSWDDDLFHAGPEPPAPHASWWSSPALATALCLEALLKVATD
ncbi:MAG TPA: prenyltransferase/squalene oxidase repeat-containing protein [Longimicrobium sp.]|nr:prenyltransferase/squalene oxidase repeat-containing protein [Longimicrobium sp.]